MIIENDPVFFYGNRLALQVFDIDFERFVELPSCFFAEALALEGWARLLDEVCLL